MNLFLALIFPFREPRERPGHGVPVPGDPADVPHTPGARLDYALATRACVDVRAE